MPKKFTHREFLERLEIRNQQNIDKQIYLSPKKQKYTGQNIKLQFKCDENHKWMARPGNILSGQGCPTCKLKNDSLKKRKPLDRVIEDFQRVHGNRYDYSEVEYINVHTKVKIICQKHGAFYQTPADHFSLKHGCPKCCIENQRKPLEDFIDEANHIHNNKYDYSKVKYKNNYTPITIICPHHGKFKQRPGDHLHGHGCPSCVKTTISYKQITWLTHISKEENINIQHALNGGEFRIPKTNYSVDGYCKETNTIYEFHGDAFHGNPKRYKPEDHCQPFNKQITAKELYNQTIEKEQLIKQLGYNLITIWESDFDKLNIPPIAFDYDSIVHVNHLPPEKLLETLRLRLVGNEFKGFKHKHTFQCLLCGNNFTTTLTQRKQTYVKRKVKGCPSCARNKIVDFSNKVQNILQNEGIQTSLTNDNVVLINNTNAGVFVSDFISGVEQVNGKYFNLNLLKNYNDKNIQLLIFFQDEWIQNQQLILKKIKHITHSSNIKKIYARLCVIKEISSKEKGVFLNQYHIQGNDNSTEKYGAFYDNKLVAVMTFAKPRIAVGGKGANDSIELVRFSTKTDYHVVGIASKLLKTFERNNPNSTIYSFADRRWSVGNLYEKIGFSLSNINPPDYYYIVNGARKHRWNYRKDVLKNTLKNYDERLTEYQNMQNAGYNRIWGCGTLKYVKG